MKYIKLYEAVKFHITNAFRFEKLHEGDYVLCEDIGIHILPALSEFIGNNVGEIVKNDAIIKYSYMVKYENIPSKLKRFFTYSTKQENCRGMDTSEIKYYSKNKEELKIFIDSKKYNL